MGHNKTVILVTTGLLLLAGIFFYTIFKDAEIYRSGVSQDIMVEQSWELPKELREISGMAFLEPHRIAAVQDEQGVIYIYDLESSSIVKEIEFAGAGDYEGIALNGTTAYVLKADGTIFRIANFMGEAITEIFETSFTSKNDIESLFFDPKENELLLMPKGEGLETNNYKGIYVIDVNSMNMNKDPLLSMTFEEEIFDDLKGENKNRSFYPSEISRHPDTGNILILEGEKPHLLMLDANGVPETLHRLDPNIFPQPEGLAFDPSGNLYISSEGNPGTIHRVTIKN